MRTMRNFGILSLSGIVIVGTVAFFAAMNEWWALSVLCVFLALFATACLILLSIRSVKWQMVSDLKKSRNETRKALNHLQQLHDQNQEQLSNILSQQEWLRGQQQDASVIVQSAMDNLNTRVQQMLDSTSENFGSRQEKGYF